MAKSKRDEKVEEKEGEYEFKLPAFDEQAFIRREVAAAKASFYTLGIAVASGVVATALMFFPVDWKVGWVPIVAAMLALRPALVGIGFEEDVTKPKALIGSYFLVFFTGLAVWILGVNIL